MGSPSIEDSSSWTSSAGPAPQACARSVTYRRRSSSPTLASGEGILVAEHIAGLPVVPIDYAGVPRITYSDPEVASVRPHRGTGRRTPGRGQDHHVDVRPRWQRQEPDPQDAGRGQARGGEVTARYSASTWSAPGSVNSVAEAQLIYNWEAVPSEVAQLIHRTPPSPRPSARRTSRWRANRYTSIADLIRPIQRSRCIHVGLRDHAAPR